jgi:hypothetical protein
VLLKLRPPHGWSAVIWELAILTRHRRRDRAGGAADCPRLNRTEAPPPIRAPKSPIELNSDLMSMALRQSI